jgi:hypothetical protein
MKTVNVAVPLILLHPTNSLDAPVLKSGTVINPDPEETVVGCNYALCFQYIIEAFEE